MITSPPQESNSGSRIPPFKCLALDLEVGRDDERIHAFAAVRSGDSEAFHRKSGKSIGNSDWKQLDAFADDAEVLVGHNLIGFDLPWLQAAAPSLKLLELPVLDTLRLNPLAFPSQPYHRLVKHYKDATIQQGQRNNPELDSRISLDLLADQHQALGKADPDLLLCWHWLTTRPAWDTHLRQAVSSGDTHPASWDTHRAESQESWDTHRRKASESWDTHRQKAWVSHDVTHDGDAAGEDGKWVSHDVNTAGFDLFFSAVRGADCPSDSAARKALERRFAGNCCTAAQHTLLAKPAPVGWPLAYVLAWLSVSGGDSDMPPWVRHTFPEAGELLRDLRDTACTRQDCHWCREKHDAKKELKRWFGFDAFRPEPADASGKPMQQAIVEAAMAGNHALGILPTGTGKSICYQVPALSRYDKTGALAVVISPLVALMEDQVTGLEARGIESCVTINGMLSLPERANALERVRLGEASIVIIAPEQLRSVAVSRALEQREIGLWVLDEAHCLSRWGHDFRPDYRYIAKFIKKKSRAQADFLAPVLCLTATAKPEVTQEICEYFRSELGIELDVVDGGARRENLEFVVVKCTAAEKLDSIKQLLSFDLPPDARGGAIIYCATRRRTEEISDYLQKLEFKADYFHAGLPPENKKTVQKDFIGGELQVIVATNAFGMGIDKPDVRLVIHADIPGSLENYLQEAGRAGRDRETARCILLYAPEDVERQFNMSARSRLNRHEIHGILQALRNLDKRKRSQGEVVATAGEILREDEEAAFERDRLTDDTRVRTAVSWLEEASLLSREENHVRVFPSSLRVNSIEEARSKIESRIDDKKHRNRLLQIIRILIEADPTQGISTDELMYQTGLEMAGVKKALFDLESLGVANNDTALTAFVHQGVNRNSRDRFDAACGMEVTLIEQMRELAPELQENDSGNLHLRITTQRLKDLGHTQALPERVMRMLRSLAGDGREAAGGRGSVSLRRLGEELVEVRLHRTWRELEETASRRRAAGQCLLRCLLDKLPADSRGNDLLAETTLGELLAAIKADLELKTRIKNPQKLMERALLWLHEQEIIRLNKGLTVFRPAMTIRLGKNRKQRFGDAEFESLKLHYEDRILQIHVMDEYAQRGLAKMLDALDLTMDYFKLDQDKFLQRWLPDRKSAMGRQMTPASLQAIVESLANPAQQKIVTDRREQTNVLVLAGPGSGKTRVLVHRIAWLLRARRERPGSIIALAYNRHAAVDIRRRLRELVGDDARGVTVLTCHGLAMRLTGASFSARANAIDKAKSEEWNFDEVLRQATALLQGEGLPPEEIDENRQRLLGKFRWILVDEYQDIGPEEYALISALSGRALNNAQDRLSLLAVGDDDQNIYGFSGASVEYIRQFESEYQARHAWLTDNYRSSGNIIKAANAVIESARDRMKPDRPIRIDRARRKQPAGGNWEQLDPVARGKVQMLASGSEFAQAAAAVAELQRMARLAGPDWDWSRCAVIAREWKYLDPVRAVCEEEGIRAQTRRDEFRGFWRLRETRALLGWLEARESKLVSAESMKSWLDQQIPGSWFSLLQDAVAEYEAESGPGEYPVAQFIEWLAEWGREVRRRQRGLLLVTAHGAKGLEFDHVVVLDGGWSGRSQNEDPDAPRRLFYVAMTRARQSLTLMQTPQGRNPFLSSLDQKPGVIKRIAADFQDRAVAENHAAYAVRDPRERMARYQHLGLDEVDLGFAGRQYKGSKLHRAIASLQPGDDLELRAVSKSGSNRSTGRNSEGLVAVGGKDRQQPKDWVLLNASGQQVGKLSKNFRHPAGQVCLRASIFAVVQWSKQLSPEDYRKRIRCDSEWEVVIPELVFLPGEPPG